MPTRLLTLAALAVLLAGCKAQLQHGLDERDANELVTALTAHGFAAQKVPEKGKRPTFSVEVDEQQAAEALQLLAELKLPRPARTTTRELATQTALIETPGAERLRQLEALEGDIEQMLESMDGVHSASVELVVPSAPRPGLPAAPAKASALLRVDVASMERVGQQREGLARLIAGATEGLRPEEVAIVLDPVTPRSASVVPAARPLDPWRLTLVGLAALLCVGAVSLVAFVARGRRPAKVQAHAPEVSTSETTAAAKPSPSGRALRPARSARRPDVGARSDATRVVRPRKEGDERQSTPPERLALFVRARGGTSAARLLDGLAGPWATAAQRALRACEAMSSAERHGRLALEFGERPDSVSRLRALVSDAPPALRCAIARQLPPHQRALFPSLSVRAAAAGPATPSLTRLAERLIREALR